MPHLVHQNRGIHSLILNRTCILLAISLIFETLTSGTATAVISNAKFSLAFSINSKTTPNALLNDGLHI